MRQPRKRIGCCLREMMRSAPPKRPLNRSSATGTNDQHHRHTQSRGQITFAVNSTTWYRPRSCRRHTPTSHAGRRRDLRIRSISGVDSSRRVAAPYPNRGRYEQRWRSRRRQVRSRSTRGGVVLFRLRDREHADKKRIECLPDDTSAC